MCVLDICRVFLYTDLMTTLKRQIQLKLKKFDELMIKLKSKYVDDKSQKEFEDDLEYRSALKDSVFYSELHKLDEKIQEIHKLIDNNK